VSSTNHSRSRPWWIRTTSPGHLVRLCRDAIATLSGAPGLRTCSDRPPGLSTAEAQRGRAGRPVGMLSGAGTPESRKACNSPSRRMSTESRQAIPGAVRVRGQARTAPVGRATSLAQLPDYGSMAEPRSRRESNPQPCHPPRGTTPGARI
jgi:hypothetical protein